MNNKNQTEQIVIDTPNGYVESNQRWDVYDSSMLNKVVASFATKRQLFAYNKKHNLNADQISVTNKDYPDGYVFLGWDEIEAF